MQEKRENKNGDFEVILGEDGESAYGRLKIGRNKQIIYIEAASH